MNAITRLSALALLVACSISCTKPPAVFSVTAKGFPENTVIRLVDPDNGTNIITENISPSFSLRVNNSEKRFAKLVIQGPVVSRRYWIFIHPGEEKLTFDFKKDFYPLTAPTDETNKEIIAYYAMEETLSRSIKDSTDHATLELENATRENVAAKLERSKKWDARLEGSKLEIIEAFARKYPASQVTAVILSEIALAATDLPRVKKILAITGKEVRENPKIGTLLENLESRAAVSEGAIAPPIEGSTPTGVKFEPGVLKKLNVVICWVYYNTQIREKHEQMVKLYNKVKSQDVEFIGVSFGKDSKFWTDVIKSDHLPWPQYSDLKGTTSPNGRLSNYRIPYIFIMDRNRKILSADLNADALEFEISNRLEHMK